MKDDVFGLRLQAIWAKYRGQMGEPVLNEIVDRGICYPKLEGERRILVVGMNPSFRQGDPACDQQVCMYDFQGIVAAGQDRYFTQFADLFPEEYRHEVAYLDMLNLRETEQNMVWKFCKDKQGKGLELVAENLCLNQLVMEQVVRPRLVMVKNMGAWKFWGKDATEEKDVWMGYRMERVEGFKGLTCGEVWRIMGLQEHPDRVSRDCLLETNLKGTLVLFTRHFQGCPQEKLPTPELMADLCRRL